MATSQKYLFSLLAWLLAALHADAQCLMLPQTFAQHLDISQYIIEGKVTAQHPFMGADGAIYTSNTIEVHRNLKGETAPSMEVLTEGGILGDRMQLVTPSVQMQLGAYGLFLLRDEPERYTLTTANAFYAIDERSGAIYGMKDIHQREALYDAIERTTGTGAVELNLNVQHNLTATTTHGSRATPTITTVLPLEVTAGTQTVLTISGQGFGMLQGTGHVAFCNADDGGQSFVSLQPGPHYLSWTDTEIKLYVPSSTLYSNTVAGSGPVRVTSMDGQHAESSQILNVSYATSEVIFSQQLNNTVLVGMQEGGYLFHANPQLLQLTAGTTVLADVFDKWACGTGVNFRLDDAPLPLSDWSNDGINVIGLAKPDQLPSYLLGKTITTFSACGTPDGIQWNLIDVDILLNADIAWWTAPAEPLLNHYDLETTLLHELGHAHLLQHNNSPSSPMYFELTEGTMRRELHAPSLEGGMYVSQKSTDAVTTCSEEAHQYFDLSQCDHSMVNTVENATTSDFTTYPNPFTDQITLRGEWHTGTPFFLYDATGRAVATGFLNAATQTIATGQLSAGIYVLEVRDKEKLHVQRLVKN